MKLMNMTSVMTMSSLEIAELTGKRHDNVLADIRNMLTELEIEAPEFSGALKMPSGQKAKVYKLPKRECLVLVSGYSIVLRTKIIDRWLELESAEAARSTAKAMDAENRAALRMEYRPMTDALKTTREDIGKETKSHHYSNEADMINRIVTGYPAKKFKADSMMFPARVGMNRNHFADAGKMVGVPRACGDEPLEYFSLVAISVCSPRVWG